MAEYIGRANVVGKLTSSEVQRAMRELDGSQAYSFFLSLLNEEPTIDAVPVVRCKDCKKTDEGELAGRKFLFCTYPFAMKGGCMITDTNHFCSYGERKDGAE